MAARRAFGCLLVLCVWAGCKDKGDAGKAQAGSGASSAQCDELGKACGDSPKHIEKLVAECNVAAVKKASCPDKLTALITCYEKDVCGAGDRVWALDDLRVLADRHGKCATERAAIASCGEK